eukprot:CAMPEP_0116038386 /NCGR_PEP_ID=MMETSP0321-20121206/22760_1 /TAXON_ID=163516 /ORGANISM="Leptocylindrus danicus var. danicus, Strain B650" /LENGTH=207 /DNA_ID=CAMNT_0003517055 /DNA_START=856 /DNA_END=1476 /DNA_ORIENTATION=-
MTALSCARSMTRKMVPKGSQILLQRAVMDNAADELEKMDKREILVSGADVREANGIYILFEAMRGGYRRYMKGSNSESSNSPIFKICCIDDRWWLYYDNHYLYYSGRTCNIPVDGVAKEYPPIGKWLNTMKANKGGRRIAHILLILRRLYNKSRNLATDVIQFYWTFYVLAFLVDQYTEKIALAVCGSYAWGSFTDTLRRYLFSALR